jgi:protein-disulfide isomerase
MSGEGGKDNRPRSVRDVVLAITIVVFGSYGLWWLLSRLSPVVPRPAVSVEDISIPVELESRLMLGQQSAPAAIVLFSDFQCPFCARFAETTLPEIKRELVETGRVSFYFRHSLGPSHTFAAAAAELAECADRTGNFWRIHDALFAAKARLSDALLDNLNGAFGLTRRKPDECRDAAASVEADQRWALKVGVTGTPFFLVGRRQDDGIVQFRYAFAGARPLGEFREMVDRLVPRAR